MGKNLLLLRTNLNGGGPTALMISTINELVKRGHKITLIAGGGDQISRIEALGIKCYVIKNLLVSERKLSKHYDSIKEIRRIVQKEQISIVYGFEAATTALAYVATRAMGRKVLLISAVLGAGKEWFKRIVPFKLIAMSETHKQLMVGKKVKAEKIFVNYPSTLDIGKFTATKEQVQAFRKEFEIPEESILIGTVMMGHKGSPKVYDMLAPVMEEHQNVHVIFVGSTSKYDLYREQFSTSAVRDRVHFTGVRNDIPVVMASMDILLHATEADGGIETFGMVLTEAMLMNTAVVATRQGGMLEIIDSGENGFLAECEHVEEFQKRLTQLIEDSSLRERFSERGKQTVLEKFTLEKMGDKLESIFSQL